MSAIERSLDFSYTGSQFIYKQNSERELTNNRESSITDVRYKSSMCKKQVSINYYQNALKFSPARISIVVKIYRSSLYLPLIWHHAWKRNLGAAFDLTDRFRVVSEDPCRLFWNCCWNVYRNCTNVLLN